MVGNKPISNETAAQIVAYRNTGMRQKDIALKLSLSQSVVSRCLSRYQATGSFKHKKSPGRPRLTSVRTDHFIRRLASIDPTSSSSFIASQLPAEIVVSARTVRRRLLNDFQLRSHPAACKPRLTAKNIKDRLIFCRKYQHWTSENWRSVLFSDETCIQQFGNNKVRVRRSPGQRYNPRFTMQTVKYSPSQMIWGCISSTGCGDLWFMPQNTTINGEVYRAILHDKLLACMESVNCQYFQHDGAPCHRSRQVTNFLTANHVSVIGPWPGNSPDLNPIENCWHMLKLKVSRLYPSSWIDLQEKIKHVWFQQISPEYCLHLIDSIPQRLKSVLAAKGHMTKY